MLHNIENFSINDNIYRQKSNYKRKIKGISYIEQIEDEEENCLPNQFKVKVHAASDLFKKLKDKCNVEWNSCRNSDICNKLLYISQESQINNIITPKNKQFFSEYEYISYFQNLLKCYNSLPEDIDQQFIKVYDEENKQIIDQSFACSYISIIPFIGDYICGYVDYSLYFVIILIIIIILVLAKIFM